MEMTLENLTTEKLIAFLSQKEATIDTHQKTNLSLQGQIASLKFQIDALKRLQLFDPAKDKPIFND